MKRNNYASFFERSLAYLIDHGIYFAVLIYPLQNIALNKDLFLFFDTTFNIIIFVVFISVLVFFLEIFMTAKFGGTAGKLFMGLRIQNENGRFPTYKESFFRLTAGRALSALFFGMGYLWIFRNKKNQAWHDIAGNFVVIKRYPYGWMIGLLILTVLLNVNIGLTINIIEAMLL